MTPEQCREDIAQEHARLKTLASKGKLNRSAIYGLVKSLCMDAARHNGIPGRWRYYAPPGLED